MLEWGQLDWGVWVGLPGLEFRTPSLLLLALFAPAVYWLAKRLPSALSFSDLDIAKRGPRSSRVRLNWIPAAILAVAWASICLALAGPRTGDATTIVKRDGIAIMLAVDRSGSMDARDFVADDYSISRLDAVKNVLAEFIAGGDAGKGRPNDLVGIIGFGTFADSICPLTLDHGSALAILADMKVARIREESATAIGEGLALAVERLRNHPARSKVVILLTDGVNNAGDISPEQAAKLAAAHNVRVYTVGAGTNGIAPMPVQMADGRTVLRRTPVEIDEETLQAIAKETGGRYFNARDADGLSDTYRVIDSLERSDISEIRYMQYQEHYQFFTLLALALVLLSSLASGTWLRRLP